MFFFFCSSVGNTVSGKLKDLFAQDTMVSQKLKYLLAGLSDVVNLTNSAQLPTLREYITQGLYGDQRFFSLIFLSEPLLKGVVVPPTFLPFS